jgi:hypothetical protein
MNARLAPIVALVGERPSETLVDEIRDASGEELSERTDDFARLLGTSEKLADIVRWVAEAVLYRRVTAMPAAEALALATSPEGIDFLEEALAGSRRLQARRAAKGAGNVVSLFDWTAS